ncbi:MAG: hypothetical protein LBI79_07495 [Nitrososphaerota archaeon]|nr:hypothetical protein [Nitrososphaerota archaeon]
MFIAISVFFLLRLITSPGEIAQGDWVIPLNSEVALNDFISHLHVRVYNGFGEAAVGRFGFPFFKLFNAVLAPFGFVGGAEIKLLAVFLVALGGITTYFLARSFHLKKSSCFLAGLFFMSTPLVFNWLIFGWMYYLFAYGLFPLMLLVTKKFAETNNLRYALINGLIFSVATIQPTFILIYPLLCFVFLLFEFKCGINTLKRAISLITISLTVWFLSSLTFFISLNNYDSLSFYFFDYIEGVTAQFINFSTLINPMRLWGSTFNYQFETYFPQQLILLSFMPIVVAFVALLLKPHNKRVLFFSFSYLFVFLSYCVYHNMHYIINNVPYGAIFESPSIFLVPASLGVAVLIGYVHQNLPVFLAKTKKLKLSSLKILSFVFILFLIISAGTPWWIQQISGEPIRGVPHKLNLYEIPPAIKTWHENLGGDPLYFVLYLPMARDVQLVNSAYFSEEHEGVNGGIFTLVNTLPYVSLPNATLFLDELMGSSEIGEHWGSLSIRYIVVYTNVYNAYNTTDIVDRLSGQSGIVQVINSPDIIVFENTFVKPVVYAKEASDVSVQIVYQDPTMFKVQVQANASFTLVFNQAFSNNWCAWVNGSLLSKINHFKDANGFNAWRVDSAGVMSIDLYYEPQTIYLISEIIASCSLSVILIYIAVVYAKEFRVNLKKSSALGNKRMLGI